MAIVKSGEKTVPVAEQPTLVLMHFLGGSGREWDEVVQAQGPGYPVLRVDLPGFGDAADETGYDVSSMANFVEARVRGLSRYVLVGHSMSGKVAMVLTRRLENAHDARLVGLVLVAPSPPCPEPMTEAKRGGMIASLGVLGEGDLARARSYITKNGERDINGAVLERAAGEVLRMNRTAWVAWLTHGSQEDWKQRVGLLRTPTLLVTGEKDQSLGLNVQQEYTMPHLAWGRLFTVKGSSHLVPMEQAEEMARLLRQFVDGLVTASAAVPANYLGFIEGERVSEPTRRVLKERMARPDPVDGLLTAEQQTALQAMLQRVIPQEGTGVDLGGYVMAQLAKGRGNGWRYAVLPADLTAYREGLDRLIAQGFAELPEERQDEVLQGLTAEKGSVGARWFEEVRGAAVEAYMGHPGTLARVGFSGIGVGGAYTKFKGFVELKPGHREDWEPVAERDGEAR